MASSSILFSSSPSPISSPRFSSISFPKKHSAPAGFFNLSIRPSPNGKGHILLITPYKEENQQSSEGTGFGENNGDLPSGSSSSNNEDEQRKYQFLEQLDDDHKGVVESEQPSSQGFLGRYVDANRREYIETMRPLYPNRDPPDPSAEPVVFRTEGERRAFEKGKKLKEDMKQFLKGPSESMREAYMFICGLEMQGLLMVGLNIGTRILKESKTLGFLWPKPDMTPPNTTVIEKPPDDMTAPHTTVIEKVEEESAIHSFKRVTRVFQSEKDEDQF